MSRESVVENEGDSINEIGGGAVCLWWRRVALGWEFSISGDIVIDSGRVGI